MAATSVVNGWVWSCLVVITMLLCGESAADHQKSWAFENTCQSGCLLIDANAAKVTVPAPPTQIGQREVLDSIARQITTGIYSGQQAAAAIIQNPHSSVDLTVFIANHVDNQWMSADRYWQYYLDCDQWNVSFGNQASGDLIEGMIKPADNRAGEKAMLVPYGNSIECGWNWVTRKYRELEFIYSEQVAEICSKQIQVESQTEPSVQNWDAIRVDQEIKLHEVVANELKYRWAPMTKIIQRLNRRNAEAVVDSLIDEWLFDPFLHIPLDSDSVITAEPEMW